MAKREQDAGRSTSGNPARRRRMVEPPRIPRSAELQPSTGEEISERESCSDLVVADRDLAGKVADFASLLRVVLRHVAASGAQFGNAQLTDVRVDRSDLSNVQLYKATLRRAEIVGCRLTGCRMAEAHLDNVLVTDCNLQLSQFRYATFKAVRFQDCTMPEADFQNADLRGVQFANCDLREVDLSGARLVGTDFRGSKIDGMRVGPKELQGAIVDPSQAIDLVRVLGVRIELPE